MAQNDESRNEEFEIYFETEKRTRVITRWVLALSLVISAVAASAFMSIGSSSIVAAETERKEAVERSDDLLVMNDAAQKQVLTLKKRVEELERDPRRPVVDQDSSGEELLQSQLDESRKEVAEWREMYETLKDTIGATSVVEKLMAQIVELERDLAQCEKDRDAVLANEKVLFTQVTQLGTRIDSQDQNIKILKQNINKCQKELNTALDKEKALRSLIKEVFNSVGVGAGRQSFIAKINPRLYEKLKDAIAGN